MIGHGVHVLLQRALAATGTVDQAAFDTGLVALMHYYRAHICDHTQPYPGVPEVLAALRAQGVALAICTNKPEDLSRRLIDALGWRDHFDAIIGGDTIATSKPDPAMLRLAIKNSGGGPAVLVGDSLVDVQTARAAAVPCIAVAFGYADRPVDQLGADAVIGEFDALLPALASL